MTYTPEDAASTLFHPLADPDRRALDPIRAIQAGHDLRIMLGIGEADAVRHARRANWTWDEIADAAGISRQSAHARWAVSVRILEDDAERRAEKVGCAHALDARDCPDLGGCPDARDIIAQAADAAG
jgi:hypothetical protein